MADGQVEWRPLWDTLPGAYQHITPRALVYIPTLGVDGDTFADEPTNTIIVTTYGSEVKSVEELTGSRVGNHCGRKVAVRETEG